MWEQHGKQTFDVPYVKADAQALPFLDGSFDVVISHAGPLTLGFSKKFITTALKEAQRVLKPGGEIRFGPGNLAAGIFESGELFTPAEEEKFTTEERIQKIGEKSMAFLKGSGFDVQQENIAGGNRNYPSNTYYSIKKSEEKT